MSMTSAISITLAAVVVKTVEQSPSILLVESPSTKETLSFPLMIRTYASNLNIAIRSPGEGFTATTGAGSIWIVDLESAAH